MRVDLYTKVVLTVIAGALTAIAAKPILSPGTVGAQSGLSEVQFSAVHTGDNLLLGFFDPKSGSVTFYTDAGRIYMPPLKLTKVGDPLQSSR